MNSTIRIGIYGRGRWASTIKQKINNLGVRYEIIFTADSTNTRLDKASLESIDWAFIATTPETHFEIAYSCLTARANVFCEKPLTTSIHEADMLYSLAEQNRVCLYVDDVFVWRKEFQLLTETQAPGPLMTAWHKADGQPFGGLRLAKDLAYHHIYMLGKMYHYPKFAVVVEEFSSSLKTFCTTNVQSIGFADASSGSLSFSFSVVLTKTASPVGLRIVRPINICLPLIVE